MNNECHSFVTRVSNDYERINGLFDDKMNDVMHRVKEFTTGNENFTFNKMLKEDDYRDFFQAMLDEIATHEEREHWTLLDRKEMPIGAKTIMAIWSFKRKRYPDGSLNKHKRDYVLMVDNKHGDKITGIPMLLLSLGQASDYC